MLLKANKTDEVFSVTENKRNSKKDIFFLKYYLDLGLLRLYSWENFSEHFLKEIRKDFYGLA